MSDERQSELIPATLGETLRFEREKRGRSIDQIAAEVRIRPTVLAAIEADRTSHIPPVYLKGYIRSYSQALGLHPDNVEGRIGHPAVSDPPLRSVFNAKLPRDRSERWFKATSYVLASAVVIALVWQFTTEAVRFSQGEALPPSASAGAAQPALPGVAAGEADSRGASAAAPDPGKSHLRASIAAMDRAGPQQQVERRSVAEGAWAAVGSRTPEDEAAADAASGSGVLTVETSADSWVEIVDGSGAKIEMDLLRAGTRRHYRGEKPFRLLLGRASSIELSFNGEPVNLGPHTRGNVARITLGGTPAVPGAPTDSATEPESGEATEPEPVERARDPG